MFRVIVLILFGVDFIKSKSCVTPYQEKATCVPLFSCNVITSALSSLSPQAIQLVTDSKCGCDMETVCCGTYNNKTYPPLIDCAPPPPPEKVLSSLVISDVSVCGIHSFSDRIKGGKVAKVGEFPWIAALEFKSSFTNESVGIRCGGSIISKRYILTAAHCISHVELVIVKAWLGVTNITSGRDCVLSGTDHVQCIDSVQKINVEETIPHESYDGIDKFNDIGLLRLEKDIEFTDYIRPICLPSPDSEPPKIGTLLTVAGWGITDTGKQSDVKLKVEVPLKDNQICKEYLEKKDREITPKQLCVGGERGKDSCEGDSGGPLMYGYASANNEMKWYQQGIVSYGSGCGALGKPAVYVKVSSYANWILRKMYKLQSHLDFIKSKSCVTPYQEKATCVPLFSCNVITSALASLSPQALQLVTDSKCGCDMETVCCGTYNNKTYPPLIDCAPPPPPEKVPSSLAISDVSVCGIHSFSGSIRGKLAKVDEFPWVAALEFNSSFTNESVGIRCGGSIISKRYILTAAHCILHVEFVIVKAWLGVTNITSGRNCVRSATDHVQCIDSIQKLNVEEKIPHESYDGIDRFNDIGLLRLEKDIEFTDYIRPICLPSPDSEPPKSGTLLTVAGWGITETGKVSEVKLKVEVPLKDNQICKEYLEKSNKEITPKQLCVGGEAGKDSCEGDSGGPLMYGYGSANNEVQWYQQGIVSYGTGCGVKEKPAVYVKVSSYANWILRKIYKLQSHLEKGEPCTTPHNTMGKCVPLNTCEVISKAASSKNETAYEFVSDSYCDDDVDGTVVCCENPGSVIIPNFDSIALPDKTTCGVVKTQPGLDGTLVDFPWVVGIEVSPDKFDVNEIRCIGTVINSRYVLTSAECVVRSERNPINVWLGHWNSSRHDSCNSNNCATNPVQKIGIKKILKHPFYTRLSYGSYDIALIFLESEIQFSDYISPICLTVPDLPQLEPGVRLTTLKWNEYADTPYTTKFVSSSDMMLKEDITLVSIDECTENLSIKGQYLQNFLDLCARGTGKMSCDRHFGAPLMRSYGNKSNGRVQWYLEGVVAFTNNECSLEDYPGSYLKITGYLDWIINIISED